MDIRLLQKASYREGEKVSVIIPCYNRQKYISECLDSVMAQSFPKELLEVIVVDDCSYDNTYDILQSYEKKYPDNLILIRCDENSGGYAGKVRNIGMEYASGAYVAFVDSDDIIETECISSLYVQAILNNADLVCCGHNIFNGNGVLGHENREDGIYDLNRGGELVILESMAGHVWGKLFRTHFIRSNQISFPENHHISEDIYFFMRCVLCPMKFVSISDNLYNYRVHPDSLWNSDRLGEGLKEMYFVQEELFEYYNTRPDLTRPLEWVVFATIHSMWKRMCDVGKEGLFTEMLPYIRETLFKQYPLIRDNEIIRASVGEGDTSLMNMLFDGQSDLL